MRKPMGKGDPFLLSGKTAAEIARAVARVHPTHITAAPPLEVRTSADGISLRLVNEQTAEKVVAIEFTNYAGITLSHPTIQVTPVPLGKTSAPNIVKNSPHFDGLVVPMDYIPIPVSGMYAINYWQVTTNNNTNSRPQVFMFLKDKDGVLKEAKSTSGPALVGRWDLNLSSYFFDALEGDKVEVSFAASGAVNPWDLFFGSGGGFSQFSLYLVREK